VARPNFSSDWSDWKIIPLIAGSSTLRSLGSKRRWGWRKVQLVLDLFLGHGSGTLAGPERLALGRSLGIPVVAFTVFFVTVVFIFVADDDGLVARLGLVSNNNAVNRLVEGYLADSKDRPSISTIG